MINNHVLLHHMTKHWPTFTTKALPFQQTKSFKHISETQISPFTLELLNFVLFLFFSWSNSFFPSRCSFVSCCARMHVSDCCIITSSKSKVTPAQDQRLRAGPDFDLKLMLVSELNEHIHPRAVGKDGCP